jgi:hypothetical protein
MSAASEKRLSELPEPVPSGRPEPDAAPAEPAAEPTPQRHGGRVTRALLVVAVVAVEATWLAAIAYAVWRLALLL